MKDFIPYLSTTKLGRVNKDNYLYIFINIGLSGYSFIRSFVFMRVLDLKELGIISLVQTIIMFICMLQIGLLNGGYRIVSLGKSEEMENTNNAIYSYLVVLFPLGLIFCILSSYFNWIDELSFTLLVISIVLGVFSLLNNWIHNALIGEQKLSEVNYINMSSNGIAALFLPLVFLYGFWGGVFVLIIQPLAAVVAAVVRNRELLPTGFFFRYLYIKYILSFGFIPFLSGIFLSIYMQFERWSIAEVLGVKALGGFYLAFLYVGLFLLIPNSVNAIFFPKCVKAYSEKAYSEFMSLIKYYYLVLIGYGFSVAFLTFLFLEPIVSLVFPQHLHGVVLVYIILPGLILQSLSAPIGLILNSSVILRPMLIVDILNLLLCIAMIYVLIYAGVFSLKAVAFIRMVSGGFVFVAYLISLFVVRKRLFLYDEAYNI